MKWLERYVFFFYSSSFISWDFFCLLVEACVYLCVRTYFNLEKIASILGESDQEKSTTSHSIPQEKKIFVFTFLLSLCIIVIVFV